MWETQPGHVLSSAVQRVVYRLLNTCFGISRPSLFISCPQELVTSEAACYHLCEGMGRHFETAGLESKAALEEQVTSGKHTIYGTQYLIELCSTDCLLSIQNGSQKLPCLKPAESGRAGSKFVCSGVHFCRTACCAAQTDICLACTPLTPPWM